MWGKGFSFFLLYASYASAMGCDRRARVPEYSQICSGSFIPSTFQINICSPAFPVSSSGRSSPGSEWSLKVMRESLCLPEYGTGFHPSITASGTCDTEIVCGHSGRDTALELPDTNLAKANNKPKKIISC